MDIHLTITSGKRTVHKRDFHTGFLDDVEIKVLEYEILHTIEFIEKFHRPREV